MQHFGVEVYTDEFEKVYERFKEQAQELETNIHVGDFEGTDKYIFTFVYEKDEELEKLLEDTLSFPKEKFILSVFSELSHEGLIKSFSLIKQKNNII